MPDITGKRNFWLSEAEVEDINWALGYAQQNYPAPPESGIQGIDWMEGVLLRERTDKEKLDLVIAKVATLETQVEFLRKKAFDG